MSHKCKCCFFTNVCMYCMYVCTYIHTWEDNTWEEYRERYLGPYLSSIASILEVQMPMDCTWLTFCSKVTESVLPTPIDTDVTPSLWFVSLPDFFPHTGITKTRHKVKHTSKNVNKMACVLINILPGSKARQFVFFLCKINLKAMSIQN